MTWRETEMKRCCKTKSKNCNSVTFATKGHRVSKYIYKHAGSALKSLVNAVIKKHHSLIWIFWGRDFKDIALIVVLVCSWCLIVFSKIPQGSQGWQVAVFSVLCFSLTRLWYDFLCSWINACFCFANAADFQLRMVLCTFKDFSFHH